MSNNDFFTNPLQHAANVSFETTMKSLNEKPSNEVSSEEKLSSEKEPLEDKVTEEKTPTNPIEKNSTLSNWAKNKLFENNYSNSDHDWGGPVQKNTWNNGALTP